MYMKIWSVFLGTDLFQNEQLSRYSVVALGCKLPYPITPGFTNLNNNLKMRYLLIIHIQLCFHK